MVYHVSSLSLCRNKHVILTGVSYNYRDILMNFVCNLRRLGIYDSLVIAAFDEEAYRFGSECSCDRCMHANIYCAML
jgi:hypothetical protein